MLYYKRIHHKHFKLKFVIFTVILFLISIIVFCEYKLSSLTPNYISNQAEIISNNAICDAVNTKLQSLNYKYNDIAKINYSSNGAVASIETDSIKINRIKAEITKTTEKEISKLYEREVNIPIGCFTNITSLSNFGPHIKINYNITGSSSCEILSAFESAGINQTIHHIKLKLTSNIITTSLDYNGKITLSTDFEIAQSVIVGVVPSEYGSLYRTY